MSEIDDALDGGATVVTPNNRLARVIAARHDRAQIAAGLHIWPTPNVVPWHAWLASLWQEALAADAWTRPFTRLNAAQAIRLWEIAIEQDALDLVDSRGAAERAAEAWDTFHAYAHPGEATSQFMGGGDDAAAFARWSQRFVRATAELDAVDVARLGNRLVDAFPHMPLLAARRFAFAGFVDFTPQQARVLDAIRAAGARIQTVASVDAGARRTRVEFRTPDDELVAALQWARARVLGDERATATIAVPDLAARAPRVALLADEILRPTALVEARLDAPRPWNLSLAPPLAEHALVVPALDLIALAQSRLPLARAASLLRSPFFCGGATRAALRAAGEGRWRCDNVADVALPAFVDVLRDDDPWRAGLATLTTTLRHAAARSPHDWAEAFATVLTACGWPGDGALSSALFQAHEAFRRALGEWRSIALVDARMSFGNALASLRAHCARTSFQPEAASSRIEILGILEAAGQSFDGLWLAGMDVDSWPMRAAPRPFLPAGWQRAHGVLGASAETSLGRAERLTAQLAGMAADVIASHTTTNERPPRRVSPLCDWPLAPHVAAPTPTQAAMASAPRLERIDDARLPPIAADRPLRGGVRAIELTSDCPFRAAASVRFRADPWPRPGVGLTSIERGILVHAAMAALWHSLGDQSVLDALGDDALGARIDAAVRIAQHDIAESRWRALPAIVREGERARLAALIATFVRTQEAARPPFRVVAREVDTHLTIGGLALDLRIDRVDEIEGGRIVIDYKTGDTPPVRQWLLPRPLASQLGLYVLALDTHIPDERVGAATLMVVRSGACATVGMAEASAQWPGVVAPSDASGGRFVDFDAVKAFWRDTLGGLARDFREGLAAVDPRAHPNPCRHCNFKSFCRIDASARDADTATDDADDEPGA
ncbi:MAG TPA: PD-(D/E)XK nuclease family protein [Casimicrobiaceae bacterium]|nr:PD-(D/E)XK nuclease family protein [Casimicrobiaceae bacterium]